MMESFSDDDFELPTVVDPIIRPYQFEPSTVSGSDSSDSSESTSESESLFDEESETVRDVSEWCTCSNCMTMPTVVECRCCKTMNVVEMKAEGLQCITAHEGFGVNCLNIHVLETSYYEFVIDQGRPEEGQLIHELYRHLAYRRFTRWVYGLLSKRCRKVLPSCAVRAIRKQFPSEEYCGFKYPQ